jgi:hypothetical protein
MMPFITIILLTMSLIFFGGQHFAAQEYGGNSTMNKPDVTMNQDIPPADLDVPAVTETATFALG